MDDETYVKMDFKTLKGTQYYTKSVDENLLLVQPKITRTNVLRNVFFFIFNKFKLILKLSLIMCKKIHEISLNNKNLDWTVFIRYSP